MPRKPQVPAFLLDGIQAQALVHELLYLRDTLEIPGHDDPTRHLVRTRRDQLTTWALEISATWGDRRPGGPNDMRQEQRYAEVNGETFAETLDRDTAEQH